MYKDLNKIASLDEIASKYNALPLLLHVTRRPSSNLSADLGALYRKQYLSNYITTTRLLQESKYLLSIAKQKTIDILLLKGAALVLTLYHDPGLRPMRDIDILIKRNELQNFEEILQMCGYYRYSPPASKEIEQLHGEIAYIKDGKPDLLIEPHWTLAPEYPYGARITANDIWQRSIEITINGVKTRTLCPEDFIIHTCLHMFNHCQGNWIVPACDIAKIIDHYQSQLDWQFFTDVVSGYRLCLPVHFGLDKAIELFPLAIPDGVLAELKSYRSGIIEKRLFNFLEKTNATVETRYLAALIATPGIRQKWNYFWSLIFPSKEWLITQYSDSQQLRRNLNLAHITGIFRTGIKIILQFLSILFKK